MTARPATAVILAAGAGGRLRGVVGERPKCLARIGDCTLVERQVRTLRSAGLERIVLVVGYRAADVRRIAGPLVHVIVNAQHAATNSLYSLWLGRELLTDGFVVLNCDVLFHPQLLLDLLSARYEDAILVGARGPARAYSEEEMKVRIRRGVVTAIDKRLPDGEADAENVGIAKFGPSGAAALVAEMDRIVSAGGKREWLPKAFDAFCQTRPLYVVESRGYPWIEIDFPEDYWRACTEVLPAITSSEIPSELRAFGHV
jgi:choline kinase